MPKPRPTQAMCGSCSRVYDILAIQKIEGSVMGQVEFYLEFHTQRGNEIPCRGSGSAVLDVNGNALQ